MCVHNGGMTNTATNAAALPYTRGTKVTKVTTAKVAAAPGTWVLTLDAKPEHKARLAAKDYASEAAVTNAETKTGTTLRQVERAEAILHAANQYYRKAQRTYTIHFTDGSYAYGNAPATTWMVVDAPAPAEAPEPAAPVVEEPAKTEVPAVEGAHAFSAKGSTKASACASCGRTWAASAHRAFRAANAA
jgi:hypothetical protein